ncbi:MAG: hypothetical protein Q9191_002950 [Dirinaria sp. TL-2023a]
MPPYWYSASESPYLPYDYNASWATYGNTSQTPQARSEVNNEPARVRAQASQPFQNTDSGVYGTSMPSWPPSACREPCTTSIVPRSASDHYHTAANGLHAVSRGAMIAADALLELSQSGERPTVRDHRDFAPEAPSISGNADIVRDPGPPLGSRVETQRGTGTAGTSGSSDGASSSTLQAAPTPGVKRNAPDGEETAPSQPAKRRRQAPAKTPAASEVQELEPANAPLPQPKKTAKAQGKGTKRKLETSASDQSKEQQEAAIASGKGPLTAQDDAAAEKADDNSSATATAPPAKKKAKTKKAKTKQAPKPTYTCEESGRKYQLVKQTEDITTPDWYARRNAYQYPTPPFSRVPSFGSQFSENDPAVPAPAAVESRDPARITRTLELLDNTHKRSYLDSAAAKRKIEKQNFLLSRPPVIDEVDGLDDPTFVRWRKFEKLREAPAPAPEGKPEGEAEEQEEEEPKPSDPKEFAALWNAPYKYDIPVLMEHELEHKDAYEKLRIEDEAKKRAAAANLEREQKRLEEKEERKKQEGEKRKEDEEKIEKGEFRRERKKSQRQLEMEADVGAKKK